MGKQNSATVSETAWPHRLAKATIVVTDANGQPRPDLAVQVRQINHAFRFGNILFDSIPLALGASDDQDRDQRELDDWMELFNFGTLPFYWRHYEPSEGNPNSAKLLAAARYFKTLGLELKGHPLTWHTLAPQWLMGRPLEAVEHALRWRIAREVSGFAGVIDTWDAINEAVIMPVFTAEPNAITPLCLHKGRIAMVAMALESARQANPGATLLVNDFDLSSAYECLIEGLLEAGLRIDALGLQTHMHQGYRGDEETTAMLDRFARFGLPLHLTETSLVSGQLMPAHIVDLNDYQVNDWPSTPDGEARQANQIATYYSRLLTHPSVQAVTYWGLTDRTSWLGAPTGLLRQDGSRKPSFTALRDLIKGDWWLGDTTLFTDPDGRISVTGFKGDYEICRTTDPSQAVQVRLEASNSTVQVRLG